MLFDVIQDLAAGGRVDIWSVVAQIISVLFIVVCILPLHEFAHGWVAYKLGDPTAKQAGRLTFNPLASIDPMGAIFILLFGFGWAKPVPVDSRYFKNPKKGMAITALAGPVSNFLAALVGAFVFYAVILFAPSNAVVDFIRYFLSSYILINISLAVFNLLPLPPLDGSRIIGAFLSDKALYNYYRYQRVIMGIVFLLLFTGVLSRPLSYAQSFFTDIILNIARFPFQLFGAV